ncbi:DUF5412 family protein [Pontibacillus yanchengensis]|uniref:Uncharacterized protein n=1 Tax=Pontibacillus yanchengensis Y32 TaxID=1385514 RepID=A0A0A2T975_9BACI|nr:DUF5412 family protein [Pontibacillus yanchengensis]KGP70953.1 hypothetical protein N782_02660 [Pontibacillus yanchengensis Y32]
MNGTLYVVLFLSFFALILIWIISLTLLFIGLIKWIRNNRKFPSKRLSASLIVLCIASVQFYHQYYNLDYLPEGELNAVFPSPNENFEIHTYHFNVMYGMHAQAVLVNTKTEKENTIYFNWYDYDPSVKWIGNNNVRIGREKLSIHQDTYDFRHDPNSPRMLPRQRVNP